MSQSVVVTPSISPSRRGILRSKSTSEISLVSSDLRSSSITFAPLPEIGARKRRYNRPIGVGNRAEMLRRSRQRYASMYQEDNVQQIQEDEDDIPLPDFGKLMKSFWRSVSRKDKNGGNTAIAGHDADAKEAGEVVPSEIDDESGERGKAEVWVGKVAWTAHVTSTSPLVSGEDSSGAAVHVIDSGSSLDESVSAVDEGSGDGDREEDG